MKGDQNDPKALIHEAYNIDGISIGDCRSIFLDWALGLPVELDTNTAIEAILLQYQKDVPDHPMTQTLQEGLKPIADPRRRGGWRGRSRVNRDID